MRANDASTEWIRLLHLISKEGQVTLPRGLETKEILGCQSRIDMRYPIVTVIDRKLGYKFLPAEAAWILSGDNRVSTIAPYSKQISNFSDDGIFFFGAYGPKIKDQIGHVAQSLIDDPDSRQAVINIWRENPRKTKDVPCTISVQFFVRDSKIYCMDTMRSSDVWLGWPYDVFNFTMLSGYLALIIRERTGIKYELGDLFLTAGSQHIYSTNYDKVESVLNGRFEEYEYHAFNPHEFDGPQELIDHLWAVANHKSGATVYDFKRHWLTELINIR